jgi:hypothetical protein
MMRLRRLDPLDLPHDPGFPQCCDTEMNEEDEGFVCSLCGKEYEEPEEDYDDCFLDIMNDIC